MGLAAAEHGNRPLFDAFMDELTKAAASLTPSDRQVVESHRDAGLALLGEYERILGTLPRRESSSRDFVGTYVALAAARSDQVKLAEQALATVAPTYLYRVRPLREISRRYPQNQENNLARLYQWACKWPMPAERSTACVGIYLAMRGSSGQRAATPVSGAAFNLPEHARWNGTALRVAVTSDNDNKSRRDRRNTEPARAVEGPVEIFVHRASAGAAHGDAFVEFSKSKERRPAAAEFTKRSVFLQEAVAPEPQAGAEQGAESSALRYLLIPGSRATLGIALRQAGRPAAGNHVVAILALDRGQPLRTDEVGNLESKQLEDFFVWLIESGESRGALLWPMGKPIKGSSTRFERIPLQVIGTRKELDLVKAKVSDMNRA